MPSDYSAGWYGAWLNFNFQDYSIPDGSSSPRRSIDVTIAPTDVLCGANQYGMQPVCTECPAGTSSRPGSLYAHDCVPTCDLGEEISEDRICSVCPADHYNEDNICTPHTVCDTTTQYESAAPNATSDRVCSPLTACDAFSYESVAPTSTSDRVCISCSASLRERVDGQGCVTCPENHFTNGSHCIAHTVCDTSTQYGVFHAPANTSDITCFNLTTCDLSTQYESVAPTATSNRVCTALSTIHPTMDSLTREQHVAYYTNRFGTCDTN